MKQPEQITTVSMVRSRRKNPKKRAFILFIFALSFLVLLLGSSLFLSTEGLTVNYRIQNISPNWTFPFGTDWLGRNMLSRTIKGLSLSFGVGVLAASVSAVIALIFSLLASLNQKIDAVIMGLVDLFLGVPHIVSIILISFSFGGGFKGVVFGIALTHWPSLTRLLRAEVLQLKNTEYVAVSKNLVNLLCGL